MRGRIVAANGISAEDLKPPPDAAWALQSDRGITIADAGAGGLASCRGTMVAAGLSGSAAGFVRAAESRTGSASSSAIPSPSTCSAATSRPTIANLRTVDWQSLGINFVMVFSPKHFPRRAQYPHCHAHLSGREHQRRGGRTARGDGGCIPGRHRHAGEGSARHPRQHRSTNLVLGIRAASALTLIVAVLVLAGALAAGHRRRIYEAVILKTFGATRMRLLCAYAIEYFAARPRHRNARRSRRFGGGCIRHRAGHESALRLGARARSWRAAAGAIVATVALGLIGTFKALSQKPAPVLRNL